MGPPPLYIDLYVILAKARSGSHNLLHKTVSGVGISRSSPKSWYPPFYFANILIFGPVLHFAILIKCSFSCVLVNLVQKFLVCIFFHQDIFT